MSSGTQYSGRASSPLCEELGWQCKVRGKEGVGAGEAASLNFQGAENPWWAGSQNLILPWGKGNPAEGWLDIRLGSGDMDGYMMP